MIPFDFSHFYYIFFSLFIGIYTQSAFTDIIRTPQPGKFLTDSLINDSSLKNTLVLMDIDDTIITIPSGIHIGTSRMFYDLSNQLKKEFPSMQSDAIPTYVDPLLIAVYQRTPVELVDNDLPYVLNTLKQKGAIVLGITARSPALKATTELQLNKVNVVFSDLSSFPNLKLFDNKKFFAKKGLIMTGTTIPKGAMAVEFLKSITPYQNIKQVIFIDDSQRHLISVKTLINNSFGDQIHVITAHCTFPELRAYDGNKARLQLQRFLIDWKDDAAIKQLVDSDHFTQKVLSDCMKSDSPYKDACKNLLPH